MTLNTAHLNRGPSTPGGGCHPDAGYAMQNADNYSFKKVYPEIQYISNSFYAGLLLYIMGASIEWSFIAATTTLLFGYIRIQSKLKNKN